MDPRLILAILVGKGIGFLTKLAGGGATAAPGLYALKIDPGLVKKLALKLGDGSVIISGTNGKTTTSRLISDIFADSRSLIHNRQGSNLLRGIASTLISRSSLFGDVPQNFGIWEVDEATLPEVLDNITPKAIILLNLFRDQLDRYGEVESVRKKWQSALAKLPKEVKLLVNGDDPQLAFLGQNSNANVTYFGIDDPKLKLAEVGNVADIRYCLNCGKKLLYSLQFMAHMGHYKCSSCAFRRPKTTIGAGQISFNADFPTNVTFFLPKSELSLKLPLPGLYSVYNVLAAILLANIEGVSNTLLKSKVEAFSSAFGRFQTIYRNGKKLIIFLIKNPAGANEVLRTLAAKTKMNLLVCLNDKIADGKDVSWIWDTSWEAISGKTAKVFASGIRCFDMATRLKYAQIEVDINNVHEDISYSLDNALNKLNNKDTLIVLPTYTAMLEIQRILSKDGGEKWQEQ